MEKKYETKKKDAEMTEVAANPLRHEKVQVRFIPHEYMNVSKEHVAFGGKLEGTTTSVCVPILRSTGVYKNVLTTDEKDALERALGLAPNALSVYRKEDNFWDDYSFDIPKEGMSLDLSIPEDYIKYKVLLANDDIIAPSVQQRIDRPKTTYLYELVRRTEETELENAKADALEACYDELKKVSKDFDALRILTELLDGRPYSTSEKKDFFRARLNSLIQSDPKAFLRVATDPMFGTKVTIRRANELGAIVKRGDYYFLKDGSPLCEGNENPTLSVAARYINLPSHQDIKYLLESEVEKHKA